jgi:hypothetical protein
MMRWKIIIPIAFVVLVAAGALVVHLVLQSDLVGRTALAEASEQLGMEVTAKSLHAGWGGKTVIRDLVVTIPLTDEVILSAEIVRLSHRAVPWLVLGRPFDLRSVEVENPQVNVRRHESGRWNVQDAWSRIEALIDSTKQAPGTALPWFAIHGGLIHIAGPNEPAQTLGPVEFQARPQGRLLWTFDLKLPSMARIDGQLIQGGDWAHKAGFDIEGIGPLMGRLFGRGLPPIAAAGRWEGGVSENTLHGRIELTKATFGPAALCGDIRVEAGRDAITLRPEELVLSDPNTANERVHLTAGAIRITREAVTVEQFATRMGMLTGRFDGRWDMGTRAGEFSGSWDAGAGREAQYRGACKGVLQSPRFGRTELDATLTAQARTAVGGWTIAAGIRGAGEDWRKSQWQVSLPQVAWSLKSRKASITNTVAQVDVNWPMIRLESLHVPDARSAGGGAEFDAGTHRWFAHLNASGLHLGIVGMDDIDFRLSALGDDREALVSELRIAAGERVVAAQGELSFVESSIKRASISADWPGAPADPGQPQRVQPAEQWHWKAGVSGRIRPLAMEIDSDLIGQNIPVGKQIVPRVAIPIRANASDEQIQVATGPFELWSGKWQLTGQHELSSGLTQLSLVVDGISLKAAADIAGSPYACQGTAQAQIQLAVPNFQIGQAIATGKWTAEDVNIPPIRAETASGKLRIAGGLVRFEDIELEQGDGLARASMEFRLERPQDVVVEFTTESWPVQLQDHPFSILADSEASLQVNVARRSVVGQMHLSGGVWFKDQDLARIRLDTLVDEQTLDVQNLYMETLGGSVEGAARITVNRWSDSTANLTWKGIQPRSLERWWPQFGKFRGEVAGGLVIEQTSEESRPLGSMRFTVDSHATGGRYGPAEIDACRIVGYLDGDRLLIDDGTLQAFKGRVSARGRVSRHADGYYASAITDFNSLDLDQLVHVVDPIAHEHIGLVSGTVSLLSSTDRLSLGGEGDIRLTQSDLINNSAIAMLHDTLNLSIGEKQPTGTGRIKIRLEGPAVVIPSFEYFNRGVEIRGAGRISDIDAGDGSPVQGYAVASTRILKGVSLPGIRSLDRLMASMQTGAAAVKIAGTFKEVQVKPVPVPIIGGDLRRLLWAQLRE